MDDADFEPGGGQGALHGAVITAGAFDRHQKILQSVGRQRLSNLSDCRIQAGAVVFDNGWRDDDVAVEISKHPLGSGLGAINADDAKVLRTYILDARMDNTARLL